MGRRSLLSFLCVLCILLCTSPFSAQRRIAQRDADALNAIQRALSVMGGVAISQVLDSVIEGTMEAQPDGSLTSGDFIWRNKGFHFRYDNPGRSGRSTYVNGRGGAGIVRPDAARRLNAHVAEANFPAHLAPAVLLRMAIDTRYRLIFVGSEELQGRPVFHVRSSLETDEITVETTVQDWFFDAASGLPLRVEYRLPANSNALDYLLAAVGFADFRIVSGIVLPFQITVYHEGQRIGVARLRSVTFNSGMDEREFQLAGGER